MATFLLIHGGCHAGWCWERVAPLLQAAGHDVIIPDLPGFGSDTTPTAALTLELWADFVADIAVRQASPVILVGHSRAGIIISSAAERAPDSIQELVYLAAFLLPNGMSMGEAVLRVPQTLPADFLFETDNGLGLAVNPQMIGATFYNTTGPEWLERAAVKMQREPKMSWSSRLRVSTERFGRVPRTYIECLQDHALPLALQRLMQAETPCRRRFTSDTDHSPFYSSPDSLVETLCAIARS